MIEIKTEGDTSVQWLNTLSANLASLGHVEAAADVAAASLLIKENAQLNNRASTLERENAKLRTKASELRQQLIKEHLPEEFESWIKSFSIRELHP